MYRWGLKPPSVLDHSDPRSKIPDHFDESDAKALRSQISELLKPSVPRSKIPDHFDHLDAKALRYEMDFIDFSFDIYIYIYIVAKPGVLSDRCSPVLGKS